MSLLTMFYNQDVTHWSLTGVDGFNNATFAAPVVLKGRWEDRASLVLNEEGQEVISNARVYLGVDIKVGDYLYRGVSAEVDPRTVDLANRVINYREVPDLFNSDKERRAFL